MARSVEWTEGELAVLRDRYRRYGVRGCVKRLPGRTAAAIKVRANRLGLFHRSTAWSRAELETLRREWHEVGERTLKAKLRGRTWIAIRLRAKELGLPFGVPQGCESVRAGAMRCGYAHATFQRILDDSGVRVRACYRDDHPRKPRTRYVDCAEADRAVAARLATESITGAANRLGMAGRVLWEMLLRAGTITRTRKGIPCRVSSVEIERGIVYYRLRYAKVRALRFAWRPVRPGYRPLAQWRTSAEVSRAA